MTENYESTSIEYPKKVVNKEFRLAQLNKLGRKLELEIALKFDALLIDLMQTCADSRELALVRTKLEEASFFTHKALVSDPRYQKKEED